MLGLRDSFGGDPSHLRVLQSDFPAPGGDDGDRNRFVVVHDTVPGGTGYLARLADPDELSAILTRAVELITTCDCQTRGKPGCHRCLYGGRSPRVTASVPRGRARDARRDPPDWGLEEAPTGTITGINLSPVVQSELERMFKVLLQRWGDANQAQVTSRIDPANPSLRRFDLRFQDGPHWEIREQVDLINQHGTVPDFYAIRADGGESSDVAIFLDGWAYHGADPAHVDGDAQKRASLRSAGIAAWTLTWQDVREALNAVDQQGPVTASATPFASPVRTKVTKAIAQQLGESHPLASVLRLGAFEQLLARLREPQDGAWSKVSSAVAVGAMSGAPTIDVENLDSTVELAARGQALQVAPVATAVVAGSWQTSGTLTGHSVLQREPFRCAAVVSLDTDAPVSQDQWSDWLHLGNLIAGLGPDAVITTTRGYVPADVAGDVQAPATDAAATPDSDALLADSFDDAARALARIAIAQGFSDVVVGYETDWPDGTLIEIAWPASKVGILPSGAQVPEDRDGWTLLVADDGTDDHLLAALESGKT